MKQLYAIADLGFPIRLEQAGPDDFTVSYGAQVDRQLTYEKAAKALGAAIMHALALSETLDNRTKREVRRGRLARVR